MSINSEEGMNSESMTCVSDNFEYRASKFCILDTAPSVILQLALILVNLALIVSAFKLLKMSRKKIETVQFLQGTPEESLQENGTYCVLTLLVLRVTQCFLVLIIVFESVQLMMWMLGPYFQIFFSSEQDADGCVKYYFDYQRILSVLYNCLVCLLGVTLIALIICQLFEWSSMLFIIVTQLNRDVGQILYEHESEEME